MHTCGNGYTLHSEHEVRRTELDFSIYVACCSVCERCERNQRAGLKHRHT